MFQDFAQRTTPDQAPARLAALRSEMKSAGVDAFLIPRADAYQGENVAPRDERLAWLTGFTGSAGLAVVTGELAGLFVDGRYTIQARKECDAASFEFLSITDQKPGDWLAENLPDGARVGYDAWLHTPAEIIQIGERLEKAGIGLAPVGNLVDSIWGTGRPAAPDAPISPQPAKFTGKTGAEKREEIATALEAGNLDATVLTAPESIAWLLNIRGSDIERTPVPHAFAILRKDASVDCFLNRPERLGGNLASHLGKDVRAHPVREFRPALSELSGRVSIDESHVPAAVKHLLEESEAQIVSGADPCSLPRSTKTTAEIAGARTAHLRDAAAMAEFLTWLEAAAPQGNLNEIEVVQRLEQARRATGELRDISFDTIAGSGPNGAIVHYRVNEASNRTIVPGELLLIDSGGQYRDGTTDITRTVATGPVPEAAVRPFTLVLKGLIAMSRLRWPEGLAGSDIDAVARADLWRCGLDYDHGTGHGVGSFLSVHEGPQGLSRRARVPLKAGMILSIEPGYYREGEFGIRSENLAVIRPPEASGNHERPMLSFETLTMAPFDRRLIDKSILTRGEAAWLDDYHADVLNRVSPLVGSEARIWLEKTCRPL